MTAYEDLHCRCLSSIEKHHVGLLSSNGAISQILAEVLRTLETVTPEMSKAESMWTRPAIWRAMLAASPLAKPEGDAE